GQGAGQGPCAGAGALGQRHSGGADPRFFAGRAGASERGRDGPLGPEHGVLGCLRSGLPERISAHAAGLGPHRGLGGGRGRVRQAGGVFAAGGAGRARQGLLGRGLQRALCKDRSRRCRPAQLRQEIGQLGPAPDRQTQPVLRARALLIAKRPARVARAQ
ncbi:Uncharacterized protein APZ42_002266, partial [Daphnia magna]